MKDDVIHKGLVRMRKVGEGLGYIRLARELRRRSDKALKQSERDYLAAERAEKIAEELMELRPKLPRLKGGEPRKLAEIIKEAVRRR